MKTRRRYKWDLHLQYDAVYESALKQSEVLSGVDDYHNLTLWTKQSLEWKKQTLVGDDNGLHDHLPALIPALKEKLKVLSHDFDLYQTRCRKEGRPTPEEPAKDQLKEKYRAEALVDIYLEELDKINKMIDEYVEKAEVVSNTNMLKDGPKGIGKLTGGVLVELDGQKCTMGRDGYPYIDEPTSRYDGMATADYYTLIVRPWRIATAKAAQETERKIANKELDANTVSQGKLRGTNVPWPPFPENCKNYKQDTKSSGFKRTK